MKPKSANARRKSGVQSTTAVRASISFPADIYETLDIIAKQKKVSLAWVVREAAERYIGEKWPLFNRGAGAQQ
jgi:metal-responsive CopG/Arc/MetJ family transcriptional regulator